MNLNSALVKEFEKMLPIERGAYPDVLPKIITYGFMAALPNGTFAFSFYGDLYKGVPVGFNLPVFSEELVSDCVGMHILAAYLLRFPEVDAFAIEDEEGSYWPFPYSGFPCISLSIDVAAERIQASSRYGRIVQVSFRELYHAYK